MPQTVMTIELKSGPFAVNCYLIVTDSGFVLVDTGMRRHRARVVGTLKASGCARGSLKLILLTHGDTDHIGNAAYLSRTFGAPIAMNRGDTGMAAGDMFSGRKSTNALVRTLFTRLFALRAEDRFAPDLLVDQESDLSEYGLEAARILLLGGHSPGSVGLLLADGVLICGDVLENTREPRIGSIMDDVDAARASVKRLSGMNVGTVFPGHGRPFEFARIASP